MPYCIKLATYKLKARSERRFTKSEQHKQEPFPRVCHHYRFCHGKISHCLCVYSRY